MDDVVRVSGLRQVYRSGAGPVVALDDVTVGFAAGTFTAIMGPSGSGKSTLVQCASGLETPDSGVVTLAGQQLTSMSERRRTIARRTQVGFVFQSFNLLPMLTAAQNVLLPARLAGRRGSGARARAALAEVGLGDRAGHYPAQLSGGQQQRVAIARALVTRPAVLFADEPTGALDLRAGRQVLDMLRGLVDNDRQTIIMVTHDPAAAARADRVVFLADGRITGELVDPTVRSVTDVLTRLEPTPC